MLQLSGKMIKTKNQKCLGKLAGKLFALPPSPILNRVQSELKDSRPVKTIKKEKYRFHYFIACSVEVTCIVTAVSTYGGIGMGNSAVELACLQMLTSIRYFFICLLYLWMEQS